MELILQTRDNELVENFFSLRNREDVANLLEIPYGKLIYHIYRVHRISKYAVFSIAKKSGGERKICAPITTLKIIQRKFAYILKQVYKTKPSVHGFVDNRNILTNAITHAGKENLLNIDLLDFFPSINFGRVRGMFMGKPYNIPERVSTILAQICCFDNQLPQGAPTSPIVSNMICAKMDSELQRLARRYKCTYTRYADDITISCDRSGFSRNLAKRSDVPKGAELGQRLVSVIDQNGFKINPGKVTFCSKYYRQEVTGLIVNQFPNINRKFINQIRAMLHAWEKYGLKNAEKQFIDIYDKKHRSPFLKKYWSSKLKNKSIFREVIIGKLNYLRMVRGLKNAAFLKYCKQLAKIDPTFKKTYKIILRKSKINEYEDSVFVLEPIDREGFATNQGTAFSLEGIGIISCSHTIKGKVQVYKAYNPSKLINLTVKNIDTARDIAIFELPKELGHIALSKGDSDKMHIGDMVKVLGFPNYAEGSTIQIYEGKVNGTGQWFGYLRIKVDAAIIKGGSGGPVLNAKNEVIGIAATGKDKHEDSSHQCEFGVIPINTITKM
jgi:RNA-directed DNA polymerase